MQTSNLNDQKHLLIHDVGFKKYFSGKSWEELNRQFFDGLASKYDRLNDILSFGQQRSIKKKAVAKINLGVRPKILDLCTGSGDMAFYLAKRFSDAQIIALDASDNMLSLAKEKTKEYSNVFFVKGDALNLHFSDGYFDCVVIGFGLRNLFDISSGIKEMIRVTRKGGLVVNLDLGKPQGVFRRILYTIYFERLMPFLGRMMFHRGEFNSFEYLPKSNRYFPSPEEIASLMRHLGLKDIKTVDYLLGGISQQIGQKI